MTEGIDQLIYNDEFPGLAYNKFTGQFFGRKSGNPIGRMHNKGYWRIACGKKCYLAHRLAWFFCYGVWPKEIDHIDNNKLNNSIGNLREVTHQLNQLNMPLRSNNTSGVKGVNWDKHRKRWRARVIINDRTGSTPLQSTDSTMILSISITVRRHRYASNWRRASTLNRSAPSVRHEDNYEHHSGHPKPAINPSHRGAQGCMRPRYR